MISIRNHLWFIVIGLLELIFVNDNLCSNLDRDEFELKDSMESTKEIHKIVKFLNKINESSITNESNRQFNKNYEIIYFDTLIDSNNSSNDATDKIQINDKLMISPNFGVTYSWAKWGKWSKCSRLCGGGIQTRKRNCIERRPSGSDMEANIFEPLNNHTRKGCVGIYKRFRICNDKECVNNTDRSFRNEQCAGFNDVPFRGKYYDWESYFKESNECELNCKPIGLNYYTTLNRTVIDGTPCKRPAIYFTHFYRNRAVCIDGICKAVHSSGAIRGATTKDSQLQCGSVLCRPISGSLMKANLPLGYLYITTIPNGATNISIIQLDESDNFLVLKSAENHYIINGDDDEPSTDGTYKFQGNFFDYKRGEDFQIIKSIGPTTRAVDLLILVKGINSGIKYEYYLPVPSSGLTFMEENSTQWNENGASLDYSSENNELDDIQEASLIMKRPVEKQQRQQRTFTWKLIGFSPCSKSCGGGKQAPIFRCIRDSPTRFYTPRRCMNAEKPVFHEIIYQCNTQTCPAYWYTEDWSDCFCQGEKGTHHRIVKCVQELQNGVAIQVEHNNCIDIKPITKEYCVCPRLKIPLKSDQPRIYEHLRGQTQAVTHFMKNNLTDLNRHNHNYNHHNHHHHTHHQYQYQKQKSFREDKSDKTGVWLISDWNEKCSTNCGNELGIEHRSIFCDRTPPYTDRCNLMNTPDTTRPCKTAVLCNSGEWFIGEWGKCHGDCFNLHRLRHVFCLKNNIVVEDDECILTDKPITKEPCDYNDVDYCQSIWHYSEWSECSRKCDGGTKKRLVKCLEFDIIENVLKESKNCRYIDRQPVYSKCNTDKCLIEDSSLDEQSEEIDNDLSAISCYDELTNCHTIPKKSKERLCKKDYYQKNCCRSCRKF